MIPFSSYSGAICVSPTIADSRKQHAAPAVLTLEVFNASNSPTGVISVYRMTEAWDESSTWNTLVDGVGIGTDTVAVADDAHTIEVVGTTSNGCSFPS